MKKNLLCLNVEIDFLMKMIRKSIYDLDKKICHSQQDQEWPVFYIRTLIHVDKNKQTCKIFSFFVKSTSCSASANKAISPMADQTLFVHQPCEHGKTRQV